MTIQKLLKMKNKTSFHYQTLLTEYVFWSGGLVYLPSKDYRRWGMNLAWLCSLITQELWIESLGWVYHATFAYGLSPDYTFYVTVRLTKLKQSWDESPVNDVTITGPAVTLAVGYWTARLATWIRFRPGSCADPSPHKPISLPLISCHSFAVLL